MNASTPERPDGLRPGETLHFGYCTLAADHGGPCWPERVEEPAGEPCERDPNEVEELLRVSALPPSVADSGEAGS